MKITAKAPNEIKALLRGIAIRSNRRELYKLLSTTSRTIKGENEKGEKVIISIAKDLLKLEIFQKDRQVRVITYDSEGWFVSETFENALK